MNSTCPPYLFTISRETDVLLEAFKQHYNGETEYFTYLNGEFCIMELDSSKNSLLFGRDVFGRKSLCWRINRDNEDSQMIQISMSPGLEANSSIDEWHECYPGTFYLITSDGGMRMHMNYSSLATFSANFELENDFFDTSTLKVMSFYPENLFTAGDTFFKQFKNRNFVELKSDILLKPHYTTVEVTPHLIDRYTSEFILNFNNATKGILDHYHAKSDPCEGSESFIPILFSGGVDSLMVALSVGDIVKSESTKILLINCAFGEDDECSNATDRKQSIIAYNYLRERDQELRGFKKRYTLLLVNVNKKELDFCRANYITKAIRPCKTVLDDSIGCVLWFATRAKGFVYGEQDSDTPITIGNIPPFVLVGSGSDEQLGGYARFSTVFQRGGIKEIAEELSMEMSRIGLRNLGRDDRIGTSNGKAVLAPFLEEDFVCFLNDVPPEIKTGYSIGKANKFLLRNVLNTLNVPTILYEAPKRAMQFGSNFKKYQNPGVKGSDRCD